MEKITICGRVTAFFIFSLRSCRRETWVQGRDWVTSDLILFRFSSYSTSRYPNPPLILLTIQLYTRSSVTSASSPPPLTFFVSSPSAACHPHKPRWSRKNRTLWYRLPSLILFIALLFSFPFPQRPSPLLNSLRGCVSREAAKRGTQDLNCY